MSASTTRRWRARGSRLRSVRPWLTSGDAMRSWAKSARKRARGPAAAVGLDAFEAQALELGLADCARTSVLGQGELRRSSMVRRVVVRDVVAVGGRAFAVALLCWQLGGRRGRLGGRGSGGRGCLGAWFGRGGGRRDVAGASMVSSAGGRPRSRALRTVPSRRRARRPSSAGQAQAVDRRIDRVDAMELLDDAVEIARLPCASS